MVDEPDSTLAALLEMPGKSFQGPLPPASPEDQALAAELHRDVEHLAGDIGRRGLFRPGTLEGAADWIGASLLEAGHEVGRQAFDVGAYECVNLECQIWGTTKADEIVVVGAHYDSTSETPGADDNASGVAATLALARRLRDSKFERTLRLVFFANEEAPYFHTGAMGALVYARRCRARHENVVAMLSLESIGYYDDAANSQGYPPPFDRYYPSTGNFIGMVGNIDSRDLVRQLTGAFRRCAAFPCEGAALPEELPGVSLSDHWAFWHEGYRAAMVTDTAPFRNPHYHQPSDTPETLDYDRMSRVVSGVAKCLGELLRG
jgi:hypothetical protein